MDILRTLLCIGLIVLFWKLHFRDIRPVRDFILWGIRYPFLSALIVLFLLVIWGLIGTDYGLQGLFFEDNPLIQLQVGAAVMLLFTALVFHYFVLDASDRWWNTSLNTTTKVLGDLDDLHPSGWPVQKLLRNGFVDQFSRDDLGAIDEAIHDRHADDPPAHADRVHRREEIKALLRGERFRLLFSPAVLLVNCLMLVILLGVVPSVLIPLIHLDVPAIPGRLPWLLGTVLGSVCGIVLACWTTKWLAAACGWDRLGAQDLAIIRGLACSLQQPGDAEPGSEDQESPGSRAGGGTEARVTTGLLGLLRRWAPKPLAFIRQWGVAFLLVFFLVHSVVHLWMPIPAVGEWIEWRERTDLDVTRILRDLPSNDPGATPIARDHPSSGSLVRDVVLSLPWKPTSVLLAEAALAVLLLAAWTTRVGKATRAILSAWGGSIWGRVKAVVRVALRIALHPAVRRILGVCLVVGVTAAVSGVSLVPASLKPLLEEGLGALAFLATFFLCWLICFWMATRFDPQARLPGPLLLSAPALGLVGLVLLHFAHLSKAVVACTAAALAGVALIPRAFATGVRPPGRGLPTWLALAGIFLAACVGVLGGWGWSALRLIASVWLAVGILTLAAVLLAGVRRAQPSMIYPLAVIFAFAAFATPYNTLDERWQSYLPAAASIICLVALIVSAYTTTMFTWSRRGTVVGLALVAGLVLLNGNAWFVAPNQFKTTFPAMDKYYERPIYLDSRAYFRETTPSTVKLRYQERAVAADLREQQVESERLATAYFRLPGPAEAPGRRRELILTVEDVRDRLRARKDDKLRLVAEDCFSTNAPGTDCVVEIKDPFYQKISPALRFESLQFVRDGIVCGPVVDLVPGAPEGEEDASTYQISAVGPVAGERHAGQEAEKDAYTYEIYNGPDRGHGLTIFGLGPVFRDFQADYVLISTSWSGTVSEVVPGRGRTTYRVAFPVPAGVVAPGAAEGQARDQDAWRSWFEQRHLDLARIDRAIDPGQLEDSPVPGLLQIDDPTVGQGDCVVLEDNRGENPVPLALFLSVMGADPGKYPEFSGWWLNPTNVKEGLEVASTPADGAGGRPQGSRDKPLVELLQLIGGRVKAKIFDPAWDVFSGRSPSRRAAPFLIRPSHDRGLFALAASRHHPEGWIRWDVALYNAGRVRPGDRLILRWGRREGIAVSGAAPDGGIFEVLPDTDPGEVRVASGSLPPGYRWTPLKLVASSSTPVDVPPAAGPAAGPALVLGDWQVLQLLDNFEVLRSWERLVSPLWEGGKPKLVIVTVSGGGIRSSVWTATVLRQLEETLGADFPYHIRLITGASGGMVGGSYYATTLGAPPSEVLRAGPAGAEADFARLHGGITPEAFVRRLAGDQLNAVAGRMAFADIPSAFNPFHQPGDRGRTLEETWIRRTGGAQASPFARPFQVYAVDEALGWRPSLVYTPMMVEDGRRLLISNLDLSFATRNIGGMLLEPSSRKVDRPAYQTADLDRSLQAQDDLFSLSAVEFSRLFPAARDFRVSTAVRMSASFPWVSPAVSLPTLPPRRVVDAGYYDNYGVNLAALWLSEMRDWLVANTSGVVIVQVRDYVSQEARTDIDSDRLVDGSTLDSLAWQAGKELLAPGFQGISTPLHGVSAARQWTMSFRNDEQVELLDDLFDDEAEGFFRTVVFECPVEVSLNWKLGAEEAQILSNGLGPPDADDPRAVLRHVKDFMIGEDQYTLQQEIEHLSDAERENVLKAKYDEQLAILGIPRTHVSRLTARQSQALYGHVMNNLKRLELLRDWWQEGHRAL